MAQSPSADRGGREARQDPFRDKVLVRLVYRHGLRASEAVGMRWSQVDLDQGVIHIARVKSGKDSTHSLDRDELRDLRKLRQRVTGPGPRTAEGLERMRQAKTKHGLYSAETLRVMRAIRACSAMHGDCWTRLSALDQSRCERSTLR
jgi:integrase